MSNLRVMHEHIADTAEITASSTAGALGVAYLKTNIKTEFHRSVGTDLTYTVVWPKSQTIGAVAIPRCNFTSEATMRVRVYAQSFGGELMGDSGVMYPCPGPTIDALDFETPLNVNAFSYGSDVKAVCWFDRKVIGARVVIDISDPRNPDACLEVSRLLVGNYWEPIYNGAYGATYGPVDLTENYRTEIGDLRSDRSTQYDTLYIPFEMMPSADRSRFTQIIRSAGKFRPIFVCLFPDNADISLTQDTMVFGKREDKEVELPQWNLYSTGLTIQGW